MIYQIRMRGALYQVFFANGIVPIFSSISRARCTDWVAEQELAESIKDEL